MASKAKTADPHFTLACRQPYENVMVCDVELKSNKPFWLMIRGCVHHDHPDSDRELEMEHLKLAKERHAFLLDLGDLHCVMQGKHDKRSSLSKLRKEHRRDDYLDAIVESEVEFYKKYGPPHALLGKGNHESHVTRHNGVDLTNNLAARMQKEGFDWYSGGFGGWLIFLFSYFNMKNSVKVRYRHGYGGGGKVTRGVLGIRDVKDYPDADIFAQAHIHEGFTMDLPRDRIDHAHRRYTDRLLYLQCPSYKDEYKHEAQPGFWNETGKGPRVKGCVFVRIDVDRRAKINLQDEKHFTV